MKQRCRKIFFTLLVAALIAPASLLAQKEEKEKEVKEKKEKKEGEQIIITRKGDKDEKIVVEVIGDKIIVNGKEVKEQEENDDVTVRRHKIKDVWAYGGGDSFTGTWPGGENFRMFDMDENRAMLGVTTEQAEGGVEIQTITKESAAEKAGLKKGDVIKKIDDKKIESPDDLSETIQDHKPGDKVTITFLRDKKEQKITTELGKWKGARAFSLGSTGSNRYNLQQLEGLEDQLRSIPRVAVPGMNWNWSGGGGPKLGISVQDTEDGKGVNVIEVDEDGNAAKAGIKEDDIITEVDGKAVNSTDEIAKLIKESREKTSVKIKLLRSGKAETVEVKIPRKLKTTDL
jgi:serine protease Do